MKGMARFQIGKNGITEGFRKTIEIAFKTRKIIKISVLKSAVRDKDRVKELAGELADSLEGTYKYRVLGFTIVLRKSRKIQK